VRRKSGWITTTQSVEFENSIFPIIFSNGREGGRGEGEGGGGRGTCIVSSKALFLDARREMSAVRTDIAHFLAARVATAGVQDILRRVAWAGPKDCRGQEALPAVHVALAG
jgi:hypothetical protein